MITPESTAPARERDAERSRRREVRNPVLRLPAMQALMDLDEDSRRALTTVLLDLKVDARGQAEQAWTRHKAPMAAYWKAVSVYAGHVARALAVQRVARAGRGLDP
jgi:hypothetical protein